MKTSVPPAMRSNPVCRTHTCASIPHSSTCPIVCVSDGDEIERWVFQNYITWFLFKPEKVAWTSSVIIENFFFSKTKVLGSKFISGTVLPNTREYCSVQIVGIDKSFEHSFKSEQRFNILGNRCITLLKRSWTSQTNNVVDSNRSRRGMRAKLDMIESRRKSRIDSPTTSAGEVRNISKTISLAQNTQEMIEIELAHQSKFVRKIT